MQFEEFIVTVGNVIYRTTLSFAQDDGYVEDGYEISIVQSQDGLYKFIICPYGNDPWVPARFNRDEQQKIQEAAWSNRIQLIDELAENKQIFCENEGGEDAYLGALAAVDATLEDVPPPNVDGFLLALADGEHPAMGRASSAAFASGLVYADQQGRFKLTVAGLIHVAKLCP